MDFNPNEEQRQFADALRRWVARDYDFTRRRSIVASDAGVSAQAWAALAELGMTALPIPAAHGGFDGGGADLLAVMQELGRGLVVEPYLATMMGARMLAVAGGHGALLEQVAAGTLTLACALGERQARHELFDIATTATMQPDGGFMLSGAKTAVVHGAQAGALIVSARSGGATRDTAGISLFVVAAGAPGLTIVDSRTPDGQRAASVVLSDVPVPASALLGVAGAGWETLDAAADYGAALLCFEALGAMDALFAATLDYLKTRQQFGAPIGKFQALQHRMADMYIHLEQARSMALLAAAHLDGEAPGRRRIVSAAKMRIGRAAAFVGRQAVQLHGGMGVTDELPVSHYFRRLAMIEPTLGDADHHLQRFIDQPAFAAVSN
jgi:alkylation response protein AidB-like acyl-CoA dehydrogenase